MVEIGLGVVFFTLIVLVMTTFILAARQRLVAAGDATLEINKRKTVHVPIGSKLLTALASKGLFVSSACGGGGTCGQCRVTVMSGGGALLPTEKTYVNRREEREGHRDRPPKHRLEPRASLLGQCQHGQLIRKLVGRGTRVGVEAQPTVERRFQVAERATCRRVWRVLRATRMR